MDDTVKSITIGNYYKVGEDIADLMVLSIGTVPANMYLYWEINLH